MATQIFVSRPNWVPDSLNAGLDALERLLRSLDIEPRTIGRSDQPTQAPLDDVIRVLKECSGAIILGIPQLVVETGTLKGRPVSSALTLGTEWNHIEAGLAYASGLPLLVIHHTGVERGIFDRGAMNTFLYNKDFAQAAWALDADIQGALKAWKARCTAVPPTPTAR